MSQFDFLTAPHSVRSVLIANRGEIAVRVIKTCRRMGLRSIAIYSQADTNASHVMEADEAYYVGKAPASESYLNISAILRAALESGADAIHPGYGFLSENAEFAEACEKAGLRFVGPSSSVIRSMGSKIEAKEIAQAAGLTVVPGFQKKGATEAEFTAAAKKIGYPVLVKASAGGGGRGMRRVNGPDELGEALESAATEAQSAFANSELLLEKLVEKPRHLEVQICGDLLGNLLHLYERDCSVQRNNQKVLEEAPAPNLSPAIRQKLLDDAVSLGQKIGYSSTGTVEFILAPGEETPYFLEVNTRLQVEHPVTEEVTGIDLVEWQLRAAAGLALPMKQDEIRVKGHAVEARLAAERPEAGFAPAIGSILALSPPEGLRFDGGVRAGDEISPHYDSMIAKVIAYGPDRADAINKVSRGLREMKVLGTGTNQRFLAECVAKPAFIEGRVTTGFLEESFPDGWRPEPSLLLQLRGMAALAYLDLSSDTPLKRRDGFRLTARQRSAYIWLCVEDDYGTADLTLTIGPTGIDVFCEDEEISLSHNQSPDSVLENFLVIKHDDHIHLSSEGLALSAKVTPASVVHAASAGAEASIGDIFAPLPGVISAIHVKEGDSVKAGDIIVTLEAMKLVHNLAAPCDGIVGKISQATGSNVAAKALILELET